MSDGSERRLRVVHIASGDLWAGAEVQLFEVVNELHRERFRVSVVLLNEGLLAERLRQTGLQVVVFDEQRLSTPRIFWHLIRYLRRERPHVVHTHRLKENVLGSIAALFARSTRTIRTAHGASEFATHQLSSRQRMARAVDEWVGRNLQSAVVAVSEELGTQIEPVFGKNKVRVIANGLAVHGSGTVRPALLREDGRYKICIVGRLVPVKRVDVFILVCRLLLNRDPAIIDGYVIGDGPLRKELETQARTLGIADRVHFLGFRSDVPAILSAMDALLMPSDHEGLPMAILEAMALGVPVAAHAVGGIPEALNYGSCGVLLDTQQPQQWADAVRELLTSQCGSVITERARRRLDEFYSSSGCARAYGSLYEDISSQREV